jgi:hypothetical protein
MNYLRKNFQKISCSIMINLTIYWYCPDDDYFIQLTIF